MSGNQNVNIQISNNGAAKGQVTSLESPALLIS